MTQPYPLIDKTLFTERAGASLHINRSAIIENYQWLQKKLGKTRCGAVVKANAYSLGMLEIAPALQKAGCHDFFVAHLDEGIALRSILKSHHKIYVLHGLLPNCESLFLQHKLIPILNDMSQLKIWIQLCYEHQYNYEAGLQFDTGMSRFGIGSDQFNQLHQIEWKIFKPSLIISHLACSDTPKHPANQLQLKNFNKIREFFPTVPASLAASSGIFLPSDWHFNLARPGFALYGGNPIPDQPNPMQSVITLYGNILQTRQIEQGAFFGYGASFTTPHAMKVALVSVGYADGFFRSLGNHKISVRSPDFPDIALPIIGRISMDSLCIDITDLPPSSLQPGHLIELIGKQTPIETLASASQTIGYEILTALGNRYHRIYHG